MKIYFFTFFVVCIFASNTVKCHNLLDSYFSQPSNEEYAGNKIRKSFPYLSYEESPIHPFIRFKKSNNKDLVEDIWTDSFYEPKFFNKRLFSRHQMAFRLPTSMYLKKNEAGKE